jgi:large conductance mechanosensitive channel
MAFFKDFENFALKGNVVDLAVAVVIGGAFGKIVTAFVEDLIMPAVSGVLPDGDWRQAKYFGLTVGHFLGSIVDFCIIALVLFLVVHKLMGALKKKEQAAPVTKTCTECLETIPIAAKRCRACTAVVTHS